jgi:gliding-associated putative ABC transporter substrate-binding component GldG
MKASKLFSTAALVLAIVVVINLLLSQFNFRFDFTEEGRYTLSRATRNVVKSLEEPITVKAYFSEGLTPDIGRSRTEFRELLQEYAELSGGNIVYEFIDPNKSEENKQEALKAGMYPLTIQVREKNEVKQQQGFLGAVLEMGEEKDAIPVMQPGSPVEYMLTTSIKKLSVLDKPSIGFIQGHGEPTLQDLAQVGQNLSVLYSVEPLQLNDTAIIDARYQTLAIVRPTDTFPPSHLAKLDAFLARGGKLFVALNRVKGDLQSLRGEAINTGLESWLKQKGIEVSDKFVIDATCGTIGVQQQMVFFTTTNQVKFPYFPLAQNFAKYPITKGLEQSIFIFASPVQFTGDSSLTFTPLVFSSKQSGTLSVPTYFEVQKQWTTSDFPQQSMPLAAVLEGNIAGGMPSKIVVVGDGDFAVNGQGRQFQQQNPDNISLLVNSIDWLSDDTGLIDLRTKAVQSRPIDQLEEGTQTMLKYLNFLLPILLVIIYGFVRSQRNKAIRKKRSNERYASEQ